MLDLKQAQQEGWCVFQCEGSEAGHLQIQRLDLEAKFPDDADAHRFVIRKAIEGSKYHSDIVLHVIKENPKEAIFILLSILRLMGIKHTNVQPNDAVEIVTKILTFKDNG